MSTHKKQLKKCFAKVDLIKEEIEVLIGEGRFVSAFVLKFLFLEQFLEVLISIVYIELNNEKATDLVDMAREDMSDSTFGRKVMQLQKLNKMYKLGIEESVMRKLAKISSFRNKTVHRLLHSDTDIDVLNANAKKWIKSMDELHDRLFYDYLRA